MSLSTIVAQLLVGAASLVAATTVALRPRRLASLAPTPPASRLGRVAVGALLGLGAIATLAGIAVPFVAFLASVIALASSVPLLALAARTRSARAWALPVLIACGAVAVAILQPLGLKVLALPKADELPFKPHPTHVVKTYNEGLWFEGIAAGADGSLYLAGNRGLDFSRGDYYRNARGELLLRKPDGSERVLFRTPLGSTAGVPAVAPDGTVFMASHGDTPGIWRIDADGKAQRLASLPHGAWPNGLDFGPDGLLYSPDSSLGLVWRVNPANGEATVALRDEALKARPFIALAPGANGLHFRGRDLLVTVSDRTTVLRYTMDAQGRFGPASVVATGIPGDDFAVGADGSLFVTTHPYNTLVRVAPDGTRTIIAKAEQRIIGATDAVFGRTPKDLNTLYVVTDGGAFTGGPKTRGELVAVEPYAGER